jgi:hypothetical protein
MDAGEHITSAELARREPRRTIPPAVPPVVPGVPPVGQHELTVLAERVFDLIGDRLRMERERRGM